MTKKSKIELNRATELADIDAELDDALAKLEASSSKVDDILAAETGAAPTGTSEQSGTEAVADEADESGDA